MKKILVDAIAITYMLFLFMLIAIATAACAYWTVLIVRATYNLL